MVIPATTVAPATFYIGPGVNNFASSPAQIAVPIPGGSVSELRVRITTLLANLTSSNLPTVARIRRNGATTTLVCLATDFVLAGDSKSALCAITDPTLAVAFSDSDVVEVEFAPSVLGPFSNFVITWSAVLSNF